MDNLLKEIHAELGLTETHLANYKLKFCEQAPLTSLEVVEIDFDGRPFLLEKAAAQAWRAMKTAAQADGIFLLPVSGFRSYVYQKQIFARKLSSGVALETILTETAIPGFSEHHTGCAVDVSVEGQPQLTQDFENFSAFRWLNDQAHRFSFRLSYPRHNDQGIVYEPWHWCFDRYFTQMPAKRLPSEP